MRFRFSVSGPYVVHDWIFNGGPKPGVRDITDAVQEMIEWSNGAGGANRRRICADWLRKMADAVERGGKQAAEQVARGAA